MQTRIVPGVFRNLKLLQQQGTSPEVHPLQSIPMEVSCSAALQGHSLVSPGVHRVPSRCRTVRTPSTGRTGLGAPEQVFSFTSFHNRALVSASRRRLRLLSGGVGGAGSCEGTSRCCLVMMMMRCCLPWKVQHVTMGHCLLGFIEVRCHKFWQRAI